jgi:hypothetical protein
VIETGSQQVIRAGRRGRREDGESVPAFLPGSDVFASAGRVRRLRCQHKPMYCINSRTVDVLESALQSSGRVVDVQTRLPTPVKKTFWHVSGRLSRFMVISPRQPASDPIHVCFGAERLMVIGKNLATRRLPICDLIWAESIVTVRPGGYHSFSSCCFLNFTNSWIGTKASRRSHRKSICCAHHCRRR